MSNLKGVNFLSIGLKSLDDFLWCEISNDIGHKPDNCLWASPHTPNDKYNSRWHEFISFEMPTKCSTDGIVFTLKDTAKIYVIDSYADLEYLFREYPRDNKLYLDYVKISEKYDGIYLTEKGQCQTRFSLPINLYGWDVECLCLFNGECIKDYKYKRVRY